MFKSYNKDYSSYILTTKNRNVVKKRIDEIAEEKISEEIYYNRSRIVSRAEHKKFENELMNLWSQYYSDAGLPVPTASYEEDLKDFNATLFKLNKNLKNENQESLIKPTSPRDSVYNEKEY